MLAGSDVVASPRRAPARPRIRDSDPVQDRPVEPKHAGVGARADRELALQVAEAFSRYGAHMPAVKVLPIYGGQSYGVQLAGLKRGAHVVVGTPGRVIDHLARGTLDLSKLDYLVLDEADEMLQMGFAEDVERILADTPEYKQVALFSATMPSAIRKITTKYLHDPVR